MITISPDAVLPGMWNTDAGAQYAIAMDGERGELVWYRSNDWREYARRYGFGRVAYVRSA